MILRQPQTGAILRSGLRIEKGCFLDVTSADPRRPRPTGEWLAAALDSLLEGQLDFARVLGQIQRGLQQGQAFVQVLGGVVAALWFDPGVPHTLKKALRRLQAERGPGALP